MSQNLRFHIIAEPFICLHKTDTIRNYHLPKRSRTGIHIKKQMVITEQRDWGPIY